MLSANDPIKPHWLDDAGSAAGVSPATHEALHEVRDEIEFRDSQRDHSLNGLTAD